MTYFTGICTGTGPVPPRKWQPNEEQRLEDATVNKAVAKYGAQKGDGHRSDDVVVLPVIA